MKLKAENRVSGVTARQEHAASLATACESEIRRQGRSAIRRLETSTHRALKTPGPSARHHFGVRRKALSITHKFGRRACEPQRGSLFFILSVVFEAKSLS